MDNIRRMVHLQFFLFFQKRSKIGLFSVNLKRIFRTTKAKLCIVSILLLFIYIRSDLYIGIRNQSQRSSHVRQTAARLGNNLETMNENHTRGRYT